MAFGDFIVDFFFGPCLDASAVDTRQTQPRPQPQRQPSPTQRQQLEHRGSGVGGHHRQSGRQSSRQLIAIPEVEEQHGNNQRRSGSSSIGHSGSDAQQPRRNRRTHITRAPNGHSSNSSADKRRHRRDDTTCIAASLKETYRGTLDDDDFLEEQSVIRRSLKDARKDEKNKAGKGKQTQQRQIAEHQQNGHHNGHHKQRSPSGALQASEKTKLESWLEKKGSKGRSREPEGASNDWDNVTTVSMASKNPYRVLGISQNASPNEIYSTYKRRIKETEQIGGSERAFNDVGNAYRRIRADIQRQEAKKEQRRIDRESGKSKKSKNRRRPLSEDDEDSDAVCRRNSIDARLKDHRELVQDLFAKDNKPKRKKKMRDDSSVSFTGQVTTLQKSVQSQSNAMAQMNVVPIEAGATNVNERQETIQNSCFYLSLAASYLSGVGAFAEDPTAQYYLSSRKKASGEPSAATVEMEIATLASNEKQLTMNLALQLKRAIEAAVLLVHPDWAQSGQVGEEVQAFSDFLVYALDSDSVLGHWAIAVFDEASGFVDVYRGRHYGKIYPATKMKVRTRRLSNGRERGPPRVKYKYQECDEATRRATTLTLRYIPGHYQPLLPELTKMANEQRQGVGTGHHQRPALEDVLSTLEKYNVLHVVTDGRA